MWDFLKKIFSNRDRAVTVVVLDENDPDSSSSFSIKSADMVSIITVVVLISVLVTTLLFFVTPLGSLYQQQQDESIRKEIMSVAERVSVLQDSLSARDRQLQDLKDVIKSASDTTFISGSNLLRADRNMNSNSLEFIDTPSFSMVSTNEIIMSNLLSDAPQFPSNYPISGTLTQEYSAENGHYGIDIAAKPGTPFMSVADGTVINAEWTMNFGYVLYVQHPRGIVSVYKHGAKISKKEGDIVLKGDLLGTIGDKGILSSGSHLHLEIWKDGVSQNPLMYLIN